MKQYRIQFHYHGMQNHLSSTIVNAESKEDAIDQFNRRKVDYHRRYIDRVTEL